MEQNVFVSCLVKSSIKIKSTKEDYLLVKEKENIWLSCLKKNVSALLTIINGVLYVLDAKANLLSLGQHSEQGVDMKTRSAKMYLHQKVKTIMTGLRIGCVWLINNINWLMKLLFAAEVVKKALKKGKNNLFYEQLGHMGKIYSKKNFSIIDNIDGNPTKIYFYQLCINAKITKNPRIKPILKITTKLNKMHMSL